MKTAEDVRGFVIPARLTHPLDRYLNLSTRRCYRRGSYVFTQADPPENVYYLRKGRIKLSLLREDGSEKTFFIIGENCTFGEAAVFDSKPFVATAVALEDSEVYAFSKGLLLQLMGSDLELSCALIASLSCKVGHLASQVESLTFLDVKERLVRAIAVLSSQASHQSGRKRAEVQVTHQELAYMIGASRVAVSRALEELAREGKLALRNRRIIIHDQHALYTG